MGLQKRIIEKEREPCPAPDMQHYYVILINKEPSNYEEAAKWKEWKDSMIEEYQSIMKNDVWDFIPRPEGKSIVTSKWI